MKNNFKPQKEWFKQAQYDYETAKVMFRTGRYIYTIFMCHLSIEKALKGIYTKCHKKDVPKTHDLNYLCEVINLNSPETFQMFIDTLNDLSVPTRYPDELSLLLKQYKKEKTKNVLIQTKELLLWLEKML